MDVPGQIGGGHTASRSLDVRRRQDFTGFSRRRRRRAGRLIVHQGGIPHIPNGMMVSDRSGRYRMSVVGGGRCPMSDARWRVD